MNSASTSSISWAVGTRNKSKGLRLGDLTCLKVRPARSIYLFEKCLSNNSSITIKACWSSIVHVNHVIAYALPQFFNKLTQYIVVPISIKMISWINWPKDLVIDNAQANATKKLSLMTIFPQFMRVFICQNLKLNAQSHVNTSQHVAPRLKMSLSS